MEENKNIELNEPNRGNSSSKMQKIILAVLIALLALMVWMYIDIKYEKEAIEEQMFVANTEKEALEDDLSNLLVDYEDIQTDNDSLSQKLVDRQAKVKELLAEIKTVKASNYARIREMKRELSTLRKVMKTFIFQIDSLNTMNQELIAENIEVKTSYKEAQTKNRTLEEKNLDLSSKVEKASALKALDIAATPINKKSKETTKVKKVEKVKVCFTLDENVIARRGMIDIYIRIARPDDLVISTPDEGLFTFEGDKLAYTAVREMDYQGGYMDICLYWKKDQELITGTYYVDIFAGGDQIGTTTFSLK